MPVGEGADVNPPLSWKSSKSGTEVSTVTGLVASIPFSSMNLTLISSFIKTFLLRIIHLIYSVVGKCPAVKLVNLNRTGGKFFCAIDKFSDLQYHITAIYNSVTGEDGIMSEAEQTTLHLILSAAMQEFLEKGYKSASLRNIVKTAGVTTGAFYGYYDSKEDLFEALVGEHYNFLLKRFCKAQKEFAEIPPEEQPDNLTSTSGECMYEMLLYAYEHLNEFKLILCCSEGTRFSKLIDEMVEIETKGTHDYLMVLEKLGRPAPPIDERLEHILITGMFNTFFELIIHEMPLEEAKHYLIEMRAFYTAGWMKIMGQ